MEGMMEIRFVLTVNGRGLDQTLTIVLSSLFYLLAKIVYAPFRIVRYAEAVTYDNQRTIVIACAYAAAITSLTVICTIFLQGGSAQLLSQWPGYAIMLMTLLLMPISHRIKF
jgi:hypothetical protein